MADAFQTVARREYITEAAWLAALIALLCFATFAWIRGDVSNGREVTAVVVRLGTYPDPLETGDLPILTVQLPDGSIRQVLASWPAVSRCAPGRSVALLQRATALKVALRGCSAAR
jgi:hypothetical protein